MASAPRNGRWWMTARLRMTAGIVLALSMAAAGCSSPRSSPVGNPSADGSTHGGDALVGGSPTSDANISPDVRSTGGSGGGGGGTGGAGGTGGPGGRGGDG